MSGVLASGVLASVLVCSGCAAELGECDWEAATRVAFDAQSGAPAFEGQALMLGSCAGGGVCHTGRADGATRYGAPAELDFDVSVACDARLGGRCDAAASARLRDDRQRVLDRHALLLAAVRAGTMPPPGFTPRRRYASADGQPLPEARSPEGHAMLQNWIACGAPVVERTERPRGVPEGGPPGAGVCEDGQVGDCITAPAPVITLSAARFDAIYTEVLQPFCAGCHEAGGGGTGLDLSSPDAAYAGLLAPSSPACGGGAPIVPSDPDASTLFSKLGATPNCGERMPLDGPFLPDEVMNTLREWVSMGTPR